MSFLAVPPKPRPPRDSFGIEMHDDYRPGMLVRHPQQPDWGLGQVQSAIGARVTVNFENAGKLLINTDEVTLEILDNDHG